MSNLSSFGSGIVIDPNALKKAAEDRKKEEEEKKRAAYEAQQKKKQAFTLKDSELLAGQSEDQRKQAEIESQEAMEQQQAARSSQQDYINSLKEQAAGTADTAAQKALRASADRSAAQQKAVAASQGPASAAGLRASARGAAQSGQQLQQTSDQLRVQEQLAARQQLANALGQQRQQDIGMQGSAAQAQQQALANQLQLGLQEQQAASAAEALKVEQKLADMGIQLNSDLANIQAQAAQKQAIGAGLGAAGGFAVGNMIAPGVGGPLGMALGQGIGQLLLNKGGKVEKPENKKDVKMPKNLSKEEKFGFKKALESNTSNDNNYARGGSPGPRTTGEIMPSGTKFDVEQLKKADRSKDFQLKDLPEKVATIKDMPKFKESALQQALKARDQRTQAVQQGRESRASQADLANQFKAQAAGQGPSLANLQLKSKGDASLASQLAAAQSGKRPVATPQLQQALTQLQTQQAGNIAQQAGQLAMQESQQGLQSGLGLTGQMRAGDISQQQLAQSLAQNALMQEAAVRQAEQQGLQSLLSLNVDETAAIKAAEAAKKAAKKSSGGGLLSSIFRNSGGKIPGKEVVKGDHIKNDTVPAMLSPGEIVIPKTVVNKGEKAMLGFIKGIQQMSKGGNVKPKNNYAHGTKVQKEDDKKSKLEKLKDKNKDLDPTGKPKREFKKSELDHSDDYEKAKKADSATKGKLVGAAAQAAGSIIGGMKRAERERDAQKVRASQQEFSRALKRVRGRRNYAKGGKVESCGYGSVLEAKKKYKKGK